MIRHSFKPSFSHFPKVYGGLLARSGSLERLEMEVSRTHATLGGPKEAVLRTPKKLPAAPQLRAAAPARGSASRRAPGRTRGSGPSQTVAARRGEMGCSVRLCFALFSHLGVAFASLEPAKWRTTKMGYLDKKTLELVWVLRSQDGKIC